MPLLFRNKTSDDSELAVWKIAETPEELLELLRKQGIYADVPFFRNPGRLAEWLSARILLSLLHIKQKIVYNELGKPFLDGEHVHVSISHSGAYVAVIISYSKQVGIDIEHTGERIHRVSHKFVNDTEASWLSEIHKTPQLYIIWGAKECAFKIYGLGSVDFRDNLEVEPFEFTESGVTRVHFKKNEIHCIYQVFFQYLDQVMITYAFGT
jgi:4'-phosphopantetheinyl transferase